MLKLYTINGSCSMGPHILLHELELEHQICVSSPETRAQLLEVSPLGKVPALLVEEGGLAITEQLGIDTYLAALRPNAELVPDSPIERARVYEALAFANSTVHPPVSQMYFPQRYVEDEGAKKTFVEGAKTRFFKALQHLETLLVGDYLLGDRFSLADPYLFVMYRWAEATGFDMHTLPKL
ncbi:MAG TPA: hypothetical protein ENJ18_13185, partial [Nannocystis exedens]|nr:hypothetical protein [Nannocystis exedens]